MKRYLVAAPQFLAAMALVAISARSVHAEARPVSFANVSLQTYFTNHGQTINTNTDQVADTQRWISTISGNSAMTLMIEIAADANGNSIGAYNAGDPSPTLCQILPGTANAGDFAVASFRSGPDRLVVNLFDASATTLLSTTTYLNMDIHNFGFYIQNPGGGTGYSQDARNAGDLARMLVYAGTGSSLGNWWLCFEDLSPGDPDDDRDFDDAVLFVESINPTPVTKSSWGALKSRFR